MKFSAVALLVATAFASANAEVSTTSCNSTTIKPWISSTFPGVKECTATGYNTLKYIVPTTELATTFCPSSDCRTIVAGALATKPATGDCFVKSNGVAINFYADLVEAWNTQCKDVPTVAPPTSAPPVTTAPPPTTASPTTAPVTTPPISTTSCNSTTIKPWISSAFPGVKECTATGYNTLKYIVPTTELATTFCPSSDCRTIVAGALATKPATGDCFVKSNGVAINFYADLVEAWDAKCKDVPTVAPPTTSPPPTTAPVTTPPPPTTPAVTTAPPTPTTPAPTTPRPHC